MTLGDLLGAQAGESERQLRDVAAIVAISGKTLNHEYLERWTQALGVQSLWEQAWSLGRSEAP